ncbi:M28 family metallopeptidase [Caloramator sp. ALD01]|uniref:M28 family metallopeptidase n=1 Tax=Caloramator sp. ALD01 TaxID=1031288 RepID=UPI0003FB7A2D|nr:M28 family metallopeptidase [Caloramator sp. ALD01]
MKRIYTVILILICLLFTSFTPINFNKHNVYEITKELSSDKYRGRLAGDKGNKLAEDYIISQFKKNGLKPLYKDFRQSFEVFVPLIEGECTLRVFDSEKKKIKEYKYGEDFKEIISGQSQGGRIYAKLDDKTIKFESRITGESLGNYEYDKRLMKDGVKAVIYSFDRMMRFRSPYKEQVEYKEGLIKISVQTQVLKELEEFKRQGYYIEIQSPVNYKKVKVSNIIGIKEGKDKTLPPIIFSAHLDHVGFDADGVIYSGALDNASGIAMLIEISRALKNTSYDRDIIFAAFNAEEEGLIGSSYFVKNSGLNLKDSEVINFDMVGSKEDVPLSILTSGNRSVFSRSLVELLKEKIKCKNIYQDNSDHAPFCYENINAVTFIHDDTSKIHTPKDTIDNIDIDRFENVFNAINIYLESRTKLVYNPVVNQFSFTSVILGYIVALIILESICFIASKRE